MDDTAMMKLYEHLAQQAGRRAVRDMPEAERLAYHAEANRRSRAKARAAKEAGRLEPTEAALRTVLSDAALMLLATDGPGAREIRNALARAFPGRTGLPMTVTQRARSGALKPKLLGVSATGLKSS